MAPRKISVFIPVYRESPLLEPLLTRLLNDPYKNREIFVIVDEPTERSIEASRRFSDNVYFIFNGRRMGKAHVLNEIAEQADGDIYLFLDSDTLIDGDGESFLEVIAKEMEDADIIEVKKGVIRDTFLAKITSYDYLSFNLTSWLFSKKIGKCLGVNGAAFAIRKETFNSLGGFGKVICEDLDLATRSFIGGARFKFIDEVAAYTKVPPSLREWFNQRKRWGIGSALWFKEYFNLLKRVLREHPEVIMPSLLSIFPALPLFLANLLVPDDLFIKMIYISLILLSTKTSLFLPPTALTSTTISTLRNLLIMIGSLAAYSAIFSLIARRFQLPFNPLDFIIYYFTLAPLWFFIIVTSLIKVYVKRKNIEVDWKV